ncbi:MAG: transposase, partial [Candidatus Nanopelagicales bacterium]
MVDDAVDGQLFEVPESSEVRPGRGGVDKKFRAYMPDQMWLMPPSVDDWLPEDHLARLVSELVDEVFDLGRFYAAYTEKRGFPPYDPRLMVKVLVFGYTTGVRSSRAIERHCHESVAFRFLAANQQPDFRSVARFRERHLEALEELFNQTLMLCVEAGMVSLGEVALDGSKVRANASRRKAGSYGRMGDTEARLADEVADMMADAEATDAAEDEKYGSDGRHED